MRESFASHIPLSLPLGRLGGGGVVLCRGATLRFRCTPRCECGLLVSDGLTGSSVGFWVGRVCCSGSAACRAVPKKGKIRGVELHAMSARAWGEFYSDERMEAAPLSRISFFLHYGVAAPVREHENGPGVWGWLGRRENVMDGTGMLCVCSCSLGEKRSDAGGGSGKPLACFVLGSAE
jgi:hypothetical protein